MSKVKSLLIGTISGYVVAYSFGSIWFYNIEKRVIKPVELELSKEEPNFAQVPLIYLSGWKNLIMNFYGTTDYDEEIRKDQENQEGNTRED